MPIVHCDLATGGCKIELQGNPQKYITHLDIKDVDITNIN